MPPPPPRHDLQEQLRIMDEARQLAGATFAPDLSPTRGGLRCRSPGLKRGGAASGSDVAEGGGALTEVQARISVRAPGGLAAYMSSVEARRREMDERRRDAEREREVCGALLCRAVLHCTV
jgi:hypothetical protein